MTKLAWHESGKRFYEDGVDRGVLYLKNDVGVPWNGLVSVNVLPTGGEVTPLHFEGVVFYNSVSPEQFGGTITALMSPREFDLCEGFTTLAPGLTVGNQPKRIFDLTWRTRVGNESNPDAHRKIHLAWNLTAAPSPKLYQTRGDTSQPVSLAWDISGVPQYGYNGYRPSAYLVADSREVAPGDFDMLENFLYGTEVADPYMPDQDVVIDILNAGMLPPYDPPIPGPDEQGEYVIDGGTP